MARRTDNSQNVPILGLTKEAVAKAIGSEQIRRQLEELGELAPFYRRQNHTLYDWPDVVKAYNRFRMGQTKIPLIKAEATTAETTETKP